MKFKGTAGLFIVFLALLTWVYFTDVRGREGREQASEDAGRVLPVDDEAISGISIIYPDHTITGVRTDTGWEITVPPGIEADSGEWDLLASNVPRIERDETLSSESTDLGQYGLADPALRVAVTMSDGATHEVLFGDENPRKIYNYAKLASNHEVFLAPSSWLRIFRKEVNELRDKTILRFEQDDIDLLEISGQNSLRVRRADEEWSIEAPIQTAADQGEVSTFLGSIDFARATGFADAETNTVTTGLDYPAIRIVLHDQANDQDHVLRIGAKKEDDANHYFVQDESRETIFVVNADIFEKSTRPTFDWRDKTIASFDRDDVLSILLRKDGDQLALRKSGDDWLLPDGRRAQFGKVSSMLNGLEFARATKIIDSPGALSSYGLADPQFRVVLSGDGGEILAFVFGADADDGDSIYWKLEEGSAVKVVSKDVFDRFDVTIEDLIEDSEEPQ